MIIASTFSISIISKCGVSYLMSPLINTWLFSNLMEEFFLSSISESFLFFSLLMMVEGVKWRILERLRGQSNKMERVLIFNKAQKQFSSFEMDVYGLSKRNHEEEGRWFVILLILFFLLKILKERKSIFTMVILSLSSSISFLWFYCGWLFFSFDSVGKESFNYFFL